MLTKNEEIDRIEVLPGNVVQVRKATAISDDGQEMSRSYERWVLHPGDDLSEQDERVRRVCEAVWGGRS